MDFQNVIIWIFDLDNMFYVFEMWLFDQIDWCMIEYIICELCVDEMQVVCLCDYYWCVYGIILLGLMVEYVIDLLFYLVEVYDIDFLYLMFLFEFVVLIVDLLGCKIVYINGDVVYVGWVLKGCGFEIFDEVYGIDMLEFVFKFDVCVYYVVISVLGFDLKIVVMFEDDLCNLMVLYDLGMCMVLVGMGCYGFDEFLFGYVYGVYVYYQIMDLIDFLCGLLVLVKDRCYVGY